MDEGRMRIAYIILAHKSSAQLVRMVSRLNSEDSSFFIHVDKKTDESTYLDIVAPLGACDNVFFVRRRDCAWGDFSLVRATLTGIEEVLARRPLCAYVILLSGQDYPIKSNRHIHRFLQENDGRSFIHYFSKEAPWAGGWEERYVYWHLRWGRWRFAFPKTDMFEGPAVNRLWNALARRIPLRRRLPGGVKPFYGSQFWCLSIDCVKYVHEFARRNRAFVRFFKYVAIPDEIFFQTILLNSTLKDRLVNDDLIYTDFSQHLAHPAILGKNDFHRLMGRSELFARKFDAATS
jgi:hypothetical protein